MSDNPEDTTQEKPADMANLDAPPSVPAGWYPTPAGGKRYWDGTAWTALPWDDSLESSPVQAATTPLIATSRPTPHMRRNILIVVGVFVVLALIGGGIAIAHATAVQAAAVAHEKAVKKHEAAVAAAASAAAAKVAAERAERKAEIPQIEASVKAMAQQDVSNGVLDGPILDSTCSPVGGGSTDDLTQLTTVFECFVGTTKNSDGTESGYDFNATMNWNTGSYTYGLGSLEANPPRSGRYPAVVTSVSAASRSLAIWENARSLSSRIHVANAM